MYLNRVKSKICKPLPYASDVMNAWPFTTLMSRHRLGAVLGLEMLKVISYYNLFRVNCRTYFSVYVHVYFIIAIHIFSRPAKNALFVWCTFVDVLVCDLVHFSFYGKRNCMERRKTMAFAENNILLIFQRASLFVVYRLTMRRTWFLGDKMVTLGANW